ncbi:hypothetical protein KQI63_12065 [bacterium]|nr:hypothetical protein [bacterium]
MHRLLPLLLLMFAVGCGDEPLRDNPADPGSSVYDPDGTLLITVVNRDSEGLEGAQIIIPSQQLSVYTSPLGQAFIDLTPGLHDYMVHHAGFVSTERSVTIPFRRQLATTVTLNGTPTIDSLSVHTEMRQEDETLFRFWYLVEAQVSDPDGLGDIESVIYYEPSDDPSHLLLPTFPGSGWFTREFDLGEDVDNLKEFLNQPLRVTVLDEFEDSTSSTTSITSFFLYKHLHEDIIAPVQGDAGSAVNPTFVWLNGRVVPNRDEFWFNPARYRIEVFQDGSSEQAIDTTVSFATEVESEIVDTFRVTWPGTLTSGVDYDWRLTLYDPFGNSARSMLTPFRPQ